MNSSSPKKIEFDRIAMISMTASQSMIWSISYSLFIIKFHLIARHPLRLFVQRDGDREVQYLKSIHQYIIIPHKECWMLMEDRRSRCDLQNGISKNQTSHTTPQTMDHHPNTSCWRPYSCVHHSPGGWILLKWGIQFTPSSWDYSSYMALLRQCIVIPAIVLIVIRPVPDGQDLIDDRHRRPKLTDECDLVQLITTLGNELRHSELLKEML